MVASYKKLWKLLIDKDLKKQDLRQLAHLSPSSIAKLGKGENVNMDVILRVCDALECDISDIMELLPDGDRKH
jgi:DNA-binding Xre family transcriptional regulator